jgi:hypothetical protein
MTVNLPAAGRLRRDEWGVPLTQQCNDHDLRIPTTLVLLDAVRVTASAGYSTSSTDPQEHVKLRSASISVISGHAYRFCGQLLCTYSVGTDVWQLEVRKGSTGGTLVGGGQIDPNNAWAYDFIWPCTASETVQFFYVLNRLSGAGSITLWGGGTGGVWNTASQIYDAGLTATLVRDVS